MLYDIVFSESVKQSIINDTTTRHIPLHTQPHPLHHTHHSTSLYTPSTKPNHTPPQASHPTHHNRPGVHYAPMLYPSSTHTRTHNHTITHSHTPCSRSHRSSTFPGHNTDTLVLLPSAFLTGADVHLIASLSVCLSGILAGSCLASFLFPHKCPLKEDEVILVAGLTFLRCLQDTCPTLALRRNNAVLVILQVITRDEWMSYLSAQCRIDTHYIMDTHYVTMNYIYYLGY